MGRPRLLITLAAAVFAATSFVVGAAEPNLSTFDDPSGAIVWTGSFDAQAGSGYVEQCALGLCDRFTVHVSLSESERAGGVVEAGVRWPSDSTDTDLDLYVTDSAGVVVARSTGLDSDAEIARLPKGAHGLYDVWVVPVTILEPLTYEGRIEFERDLSPVPERDLLPNMTTLEPHTIVLEASMEFHAIHAHWHYSGFGLGRLYDTNGALVAQGNKVGFCLIDVEIQGWAQPGNGPRSYSAPGCLTPDLNQQGDVVMGISSGWADVYNWFLADQFIDVTGVADGTYRLEVVADPLNTLRESDETDNAGSTWICLTGSTVRKGMC